MGFTMILYPTTLLFRMTHAIQRGLKDLYAGQELSSDESVNMKEFEELVEAGRWRKIERKYGGGPEWDED